MGFVSPLRPLDLINQPQLDSPCTPTLQTDILKKAKVFRMFLGSEIIVNFVKANFSS